MSNALSIFSLASAAMRCQPHLLMLVEQLLPLCLCTSTPVHSCAGQHAQILPSMPRQSLHLHQVCWPVSHNTRLLLVGIIASAIRLKLACFKVVCASPVCGTVGPRSCAV